jgi:hypothetical protein
MNKWTGLSPEEKRRQRFKRWLSPDVKFSSPEAENGYKARVTRFIKAIELEEPDRVPVMLPVGFFRLFMLASHSRRPCMITTNSAGHG